MKSVIKLENVNVRMIDLPTTIKAYVVSNTDQSYTIFLNSNLNHEQNMKSYMHEMKHITNGDYDKKCSVDLIEINAHKNK